MKDTTKITRADMALIPSLLPYTTPAQIPLSFKLDGVAYKGIPDKFSPKANFRRIDTGVLQTAITAELGSGLELRVEYYEYCDFPVTEWVAFFTNRGDKNSMIVSDIKIIDALLPGKGELTLVHSNGDTCSPEGYEVYTDKLTAPLTIAPDDGTPCHGAAPYFTLKFQDHTVRAAVGWPSQWETTIAPEKDGAALVCGQQRCHMYIKPGETMRTPRVTLCGYFGDEVRGINVWRRFYMAHIIPKAAGEPIKPMLCVHFIGEGGHEEFTGATEVGQINAIREYKRRGIDPDVWWLDAGWYPCNFEWPRTGNWFHNVEHFPNGLGPVGNECRKNDMELLLWFEPERLKADSEINRDHPEWVLSRKVEDGNADRLLNLGDPAALAWITDRIDKLIKDYRVGVYRQDFNFPPIFIWRDNEDEDRIGAVENLHSQGYLAFWDALLARNPGLIIDSCASGGRRNDIETMRRSITLQYTDVGLGDYKLKQKQHRLMFEWMPYFRAHAMSWDVPESVDSFSYHIAMAPAVTSMLCYNDNDELFDLSKKMIPMWRDAADIMLAGDYYPLTECRCSSEDYYAMQFALPCGNKGFFQVVRNPDAEPDTFVVKLRVDPERSYELENRESGEKISLSGKELEKGFTVSIPKRSGALWFYNAL